MGSSTVSPGATYTLKIVAESGCVMYQNDEFRDFDKYRIGRLLLPVSGFDPGIYKLIISKSSAVLTDSPQEYLFEISEKELPLFLIICKIFLARQIYQLKIK